MYLEAFPGPAGVVSLSGEVIDANEELRSFGIKPKTNVLNVLSSNLLEKITPIITDLNKKKETGQKAKLYREMDINEKFYSIYIGLIGENIVFYAHDETNLRQMTTNLVRDASIDPLTGLLNRRRFIQEVSIYRIPPGSSPFLIFFDIDHFKRVNDTYGHDAGDDILRHVSVVARQTIRVSDILARAGGEEFLIYGSSKDIHNVVNLAERLRKTIEESKARAKQKTEEGDYKEIFVPITISLGIDFGFKPVNELISNSDIALYTSKETGRNRITVFKTGMAKK